MPRTRPSTRPKGATSTVICVSPSAILMVPLAAMPTDGLSNVPLASIAKGVFFAMLGVLILAGGYFGYGMLKESNIVETKRDAVNKFVREAALQDDPKRFAATGAQAPLRMSPTSSMILVAPTSPARITVKPFDRIPARAGLTFAGMTP